MATEQLLPFMSFDGGKANIKKKRIDVSALQRYIIRCMKTGDSSKT